MAALRQAQSLTPHRSGPGAVGSAACSSAELIVATENGLVVGGGLSPSGSWCVKRSTAEQLMTSALIDDHSGPRSHLSLPTDLIIAGSDAHVAVLGVAKVNPRSRRDGENSYPQVLVVRNGGVAVGGSVRRVDDVGVTSVGPLHHSGPRLRHERGCGHLRGQDQDVEVSPS